MDDCPRTVFAHVCRLNAEVHGSKKVGGAHLFGRAASGSGSAIPSPCTWSGARNGIGDSVRPPFPSTLWRNGRVMAAAVRNVKGTSKTGGAVANVRVPRPALRPRGPDCRDALGVPSGARAICGQNHAQLRDHFAPSAPNPANGNRGKITSSDLLGKGIGGMARAQRRRTTPTRIVRS